MGCVGPIVELRSLPELLACAGGDAVITWAAQQFTAGVRSWRLGDAVVVASKGLSRRHRLAVRGPDVAVASLVRHAFAEVGPARPLGSPDLMAAICRRVESLRLIATFGWMQGTTRGADDTRARVIADDEMMQVDALLDLAFPASHARPGERGVRRWWGVVEQGQVLSCAADAWSAPTVGFLAGVASHPGSRGLGLGRVAVAAAVNAIVETYGCVALMVDESNTAARTLYASLGLTWQDLAAAALPRRAEAGAPAVVARRPAPAG